MLLHLVAVLLIFILALLPGDVLACEPLFHVAQRLNGLLLALVADLPGLLLAVLGIAVLLCFLGTSLHLQLADLLRLEVAVLLLNWEGEDVGELLAEPVDIGLTHLNLNLSWNVITILLGSSRTHDLFTVHGTFLLAIELYGVCTSDIVDGFLFHIAVGRLHVTALVVILGSGINVVGGVAHSVLPGEAPLYLVRLLERLVVDGLHQVAYQLVNIEADTFNVGLYDAGAVLVHNWLAYLLVLCPASLLFVRLTLVLEDHLLHLMAVWVLVDAVAPHVGLPNIWIVVLNWCRSWILRRW